MEEAGSEIIRMDPRFATTRNVTTSRPETVSNMHSKVKTALFVVKSASQYGSGGLRTRGYFKKSIKDKPLVTIITVVLNGADYLEQTIESVINQTYDNIEYIIVDGGSRDKTVDIIKSYDGVIDYWISEKDKGISDAFNKGISLATGKMIGILNASDWYEKDAVEIAVACLKKGRYFCYGGCTYVDSDGNKRHIAPEKNYDKRIRKYMPHLNHPTVFIWTDIYYRLGTFSTDYKFAMDYEFFLRILPHGIIGTPIDKNIAFMRHGGSSERTYQKTREEVLNISVRHGLSRVFARYYYLLLMAKYAMRKILNVV